MRVVAHFIDGRVLKGESLDVDAGRPVCHITPPGESRTTVELAQLKALFVVRSLAGDSHRQDTHALARDDERRLGAHPVEVVFKDGERLLGLTVHYPPAGERFFLSPADPASNNQRILVNRAAVTDIRCMAVATQASVPAARLNA